MTPASQGKTWNAMARMIAAMASFAIMNILIRLVSLDLPTPEIVFLRNVFATCMFLPYITYVGKDALKTPRITRHVWRALVGIISMELWFYALAIMPLTDATALSFTSPLWATLMAVFFLGERIGIHRFAALIIGFIGAMLILRPSPDLGIQISSYIVLISAMLMAAASILVKSLTHTDPVWRIVFYMSLFMSMFSLVPAFYVWQPITPHQLTLIFGIACFSVLAHLLMVSAFTRASLVILMPLDFMRLVFTAILAHLAFHERLDKWTAVGATIIIASTCYISYRESRKNRAIAETPKCI